MSVWSLKFPEPFRMWQRHYKNKTSEELLSLGFTLAKDMLYSKPERLPEMEARMDIIQEILAGRMKGQP